MTRELLAQEQMVTYVRVYTEPPQTHWAWCGQSKGPEEEREADSTAVLAFLRGRNMEYVCCDFVPLLALGSLGRGG